MIMLFLLFSAEFLPHKEPLFHIASWACLGATVDFVHWISFEHFSRAIASHAAVATWCRWLHINIIERGQEMPCAARHYYSEMFIITDIIARILILPRHTAFIFAITRWRALSFSYFLFFHVSLFSSPATEASSILFSLFFVFYSFHARALAMPNAPQLPAISTYAFLSHTGDDYIIFIAWLYYAWMSFSSIAADAVDIFTCCRFSIWEMTLPPLRHLVNIIFWYFHTSLFE